MDIQAGPAVSRQARPAGASARRGAGVRARGFSVVELVVTLAVAAIVLASAVPSLGTMVRNNRLASASNELVTALQLARAEATRRGRPVSLCSSDDGATCAASTQGWAGRRWLVFQDAASSGAPVTAGAGFELIRVFNGLEPGLALTSPQRYLRFASNGSVAPAAAEQWFRLQPDACAGEDRRSIAVSRLGRVRTTWGACT